jgi:hypothetical protein
MREEFRRQETVYTHGTEDGATKTRATEPRRSGEGMSEE